jgi:hypothetical protein
MYKSSTFFLAQGVLRKKVRLDLMPGLLLKQLMGILRPKSSQPKNPTSSSRMAANVLPCNGSFDIFCNWLAFLQNAAATSCAKIVRLYTSNVVPTKKRAAYQQPVSIVFYIFYCASDTLTCMPALVLVMGALLDT